MDNNFIIKPVAITQDKRLTPLEQDYTCLIAFFQKCGGCIASNNYFAQYFGVARQTACDVIKSLLRKGIITSHHKYSGKKIIERTITITDENCKNALFGDSENNLLTDSRKSGTGLVGNYVDVSRELCQS